jgi:hypothetical protein
MEVLDDLWAIGYGRGVGPGVGHPLAARRLTRRPEMPCVSHEHRAGGPKAAGSRASARRWLAA